MKIEHTLRKNLQKILNNQLKLFKIIKTIPEEYHNTDYKSIIIWKSMDNNIGGAEAYWSEDKPKDFIIRLL